MICYRDKTFCSHTECANTTCYRYFTEYDREKSQKMGIGVAMSDFSCVYSVVPLNDTNEFVATCAEFPSLCWIDLTEEQALTGIINLINDYRNEKTI